MKTSLIMHYFHTIPHSPTDIAVAGQRVGVAGQEGDVEGAGHTAGQAVGVEGAGHTAGQEVDVEGAGHTAGQGAAGGRSRLEEVGGRSSLEDAGRDHEV